MAFYKTSWFKYLKNFIIGVGAAVVMIGALGKINSEPWGGPAITAGLMTEAFLFFILGVLPPEKDYYWDKLYPGLDKYNSQLQPLSSEGAVKPIDGQIVEGQLGGMLGELQSMSKSLGSLKALQEVDFNQAGDQIKTMGNFYEKMNEAMTNMADSVEDTKRYKDQLLSLNDNLSSLNGVYGNVLNAFGKNQ